MQADRNGAISHSANLDTLICNKPTMLIDCTCQYYPVAFFKCQPMAWCVVRSKDIEAVAERFQSSVAAQTLMLYRYVT